MRMGLCQIKGRVHQHGIYFTDGTVNILTELTCCRQHHGPSFDSGSGQARRMAVHRVFTQLQNGGELA